MNTPLYQLKFTPHLGNCSEPFVVGAETSADIVRLAMALNCYQTFLAQNNHSNYPKSRAVFTRGGVEKFSLVEELNAHPYHKIPSTDELKDGAEARDCRLRVLWFPQVPCKPFGFPVKNLEEAKRLFDALALYDIYLLEKCSNMRADYANTGNLEMLPDNFQQMIEEGDLDEDSQGWMSWYYDNPETGEYFDDFSEWLAAQP